MKQAAPLCTALLLAMLVTLPSPAAQQASPSTAAGIVGTWTLVSIDQGLERGAPTRLPNPRGVLILDAAGHVYEFVTHGVPQGSTPNALSPAQLTFATYGGFWGSYRATPAQQRITFQSNGAISPNLMGREIVRSIEQTGDRLIMTSLPGEPHTQGGRRWTWERVPTVDNFGGGYRGVVGFWQHVVEKRVNLSTGAVLSESRRAPSVIVYTPSGYVGVHFPPLDRKPFQGDAPTDEEARAARMGYVGYFGALGVYPGMVFHQVLAGVSPAQGSTLKRFYEVAGEEVTITFPPTTNQQGQEMTTLVTLRRLSGASDMLPNR